MKLDGTSVVVTGANGFIGSWLCRKLVEKGAKVTAFVHHNTDTLQLHGIENKVVVEKGDVCDFEEVKKIFEKSRCKICFHLAAVSSRRDARQDVLNAFQTNVMGTLNVLEAARQSRAAVCYVSSVKVYGGNNEKGYSEKDELLGKSAYGISKICAEKICRMFAENHGLNVSIARPGLVYGWPDLNLRNLVPATVKAVLENKSPRVNGTGESRCDFVFVEDVVEAMIAMGEKQLEESMPAEAFNIGSESASVREVVEKIIKLSGKGIEINFVGEEEPFKDKLLTAKAEKILGWKPRYSLDKALKKTVEWYKSNAEVLG